MRSWIWVFVAMLLCQQLSLFRVMAAKKERKKMKEPNQYTEPFNATLSNSEELHGQSKRGLVGPPGPPGPQGPPGAPGAEITREVLMQEFKEILKEAIERRASLAISAHPSQLPPLLLSLEEISPHKRVEEAFHCKLKGQVIVDKKTLVELQNFQSPLAKGAFLRGSGLNLATGRFTAPVSGIYQFSANVHIDHSELKSKVQLRARDNVRVLICIESLCHRYTSLEVIAGLESNSKIFTVYVHGLLQLQAGQYTSIFVDNSAGAPVSIQNGSDFMGMFMGA
ncbi:adipolin isoform X3 [Alligator mississippiensis]|uniref:adipolin isoform X3 n=1 Tax=Alligator mississippiensis TaxID=8496 RepID=UPI00090734AA|nr:adipolin isoform X3 [Alligator mississippiensis]